MSIVSHAGLVLSLTFSQQVGTICKHARPKIQKWISDAQADDPESLGSLLFPPRVHSFIYIARTLITQTHSSRSTISSTMSWIDTTDTKKEIILLPLRHNLRKQRRLCTASSEKLMIPVRPCRAANDLIDFEGAQSQASRGPKSDAAELEELFGGMSPPSTSNPTQLPRQAISLGSPSPAPQTSSSSFPSTNSFTPAQSQSLWNNSALMGGSGVMQPTPPSASSAFGTLRPVGAGNARLPPSGLQSSMNASPASPPAVQPTASSAVPTKKDPFADLEGLF